ncbi:MAG: DUF106 domain-containing protein [Methanobacteriota archaeon]
MADEADAETGGDTGTAQTARPTPQPPSLSRFFLIFLFLLGMWTIFDPTLASGFAFVVGTVLEPIIGFGGRLPVVTVLLAGLLTTTVSSTLRHYFTDWVKQARTQRWLRAWQKERLDAVRKGNKARVEMLVEIQRERQKDLMTLQLDPMKSTALTLFLFIAIFNWLRTFVDVHVAQAGNLWIAVPWSSNVLLTITDAVFPNWLLLYSLLAIPFGQIVTRVLKYLRFRRRLEELGVPLRAEPGRAA